jgi:WD repeat-containing protein 35
MSLVFLVQSQEFDGGGSSDQICCICSSQKYLIVGRESGIVHRYNLPMLDLDTKELLECRPQGTST